jgi:hypothetical protein
MFEPPYFLASQADLAPLLGSIEDFWICLALGPDISGHLHRATTKSFLRTCLARSLGSRGIFWTYPVPEPDMSAQLIPPLRLSPLPDLSRPVSGFQ